jgi:TfoX/Sxy family transcriptional regulator of competence genes
MNVPKSSDEEKVRRRALIADAPGVEVKEMFGKLGAFVNGSMFAGQFGSAIGVKLIEASISRGTGAEGLAQMLGQPWITRFSGGR